MKEMLFVDTNIFLRFFAIENKKSYLECKNLLAQISEAKIKAHTSTIILSEIYFTLSSYYRFNKKPALKVLQSITNLKSLKIIDKYDIKYTLDLFTQYNVKFVDCLIASITPIRSGEMTVISYDKDFDKLKIKRKKPEQLIDVNNGVL